VAPWTRKLPNESLTVPVKGGNCSNNHSDSLLFYGFVGRLALGLFKEEYRNIIADELKIA